MRDIPLFVINGRISDATFKSYKCLKGFFTELFKNYTGILTQSEEDREKFIQIGAPEEKTRVMKNLKFDVKRIDSNIEIGKGSNRVIIAGSTHKGEDEIILESEDNSGYNKKETESFNKFSPGDAFSAYKYREDEEGSNLNYKDSQNPYQMSDALLRKFKAEEEDSIAKFKAAFQSPEEIAKAVRTEMHKDG